MQTFADDDLSFDITSTPSTSYPTAQSTPVVLNKGKSSSMLTTPNNSQLESSSTPKAHRGSPVRTHKLSEAPRTPTPFKKALADIYNREEPLSRTVS